MNYMLFFTVTILLNITYIYMGRFFSKKTISKDDYYATRPTFGGIALTLSFFATQLGGGSLIGAAEEAYKNGWIVLFYPMGISFGLILLSMGFGKKINKMNLSTIAELFEKIYGSKKQRKFVSIVSMITMFLILIGQGIAIKQFLFSIGLPSKAIFILFFLALTIYTVYGGLKAVVYSDVIQSIFILSIFILIAVFLPFNINFSSIDIFSKAFSMKSIPWSSWFLMPLLFMLIEQDMGQRCISAKSARSIKWGGIFSAILLFISSFFAIFLGVLAKKYGIKADGNSSILMNIVSKVSSRTIFSLFATSFFMVIVSTADSVLCSIGSNLTYDFSFFKRAKNLNTSKVILFFIGLIAAICALYFKNIVPLFILAYEFSVYVLFIPTIGALFSDRLNKEASLLSIIFGFVSFLFFKCFLTDLFLKELIIFSFSGVGFYFGKKIVAVKRKQLEG